MSRRPLEAQHTNPFRQSIIARSESPFEPVPSMTNFGNSSAPSLSRTSSANPFGEVLEPEFDLEDCEDEDLLEEPPAYNDVVTVPKRVEEKPSTTRPPHDSQKRRGSDRGTSQHRSSHERRPIDDKARSGSYSGPSGRAGSHSGSHSASRSADPEQDRERLEREHRRLIEREKYYRERRRELERRQNRTPEEQQRDKERRRRRREAKAAQDGSHSSGSTGRSRSKSESVVKLDKKGRPLDTIDKMDVTGLFGPGAFHHDGPFDACNPHRNKKNNPRPPVAAFNIEGPNFSLIPGDVHEERIRQEATVFGKYDDQPEDESPSAGVHGSTTMGLGSTTFMDGTPASKDAIQEARLDGRPTRSLSRRYNQSPDNTQEQKGGLLGRVRSLRRPN